jgi:predicted transcriptional regulator
MMMNNDAMPARKIGQTPDRLTVLLDASERERLELLSRRTDRSLAWHVREALRQYLPRAHETPQNEKAG